MKTNFLFCQHQKLTMQDQFLPEIENTLQKYKEFNEYDKGKISNES